MACIQGKRGTGKTKQRQRQERKRSEEGLGGGRLPEMCATEEARAGRSPYKTCRVNVE